MPFFTSAGGVRLKYELEGDGPWLLLHLGAGCDSGLWRAAGYVPALAERYTCILFDHRGHGESDRPAGAAAHRLDSYVADVIGVLDHLGAERAAYWGYSNGISVGLRLAETHPERVWAVVGSGALGRPVPADKLRASVESGVAELRSDRWEPMIAHFDQQERDPVPEWMKARIRATDLDQIIGWNEARAESGWWAWDSLSHVSAPTLFVTGELEDPADLVAEGAARMPDGRRLRVAGEGHINAFLKSEQVLPAAQEFLAAHQP